jgi:nitrous oxide reductase
MSPYSGLLDMIEKAELVKKEGNSLVYTTLDGEIIKKFRKAWEANVDGCLDKVMSEYSQKATTKISTGTPEEEGTE